jgi:enoyl-CoA hydratase
VSADYENIQTETKGRVGIIRLHRPKALNALCADLVRELGQALDAFEADPGIGCLVLTGRSSLPWRAMRWVAAARWR